MIPSCLVGIAIGIVRIHSIAEYHTRNHEELQEALPQHCYFQIYFLLIRSAQFRLLGSCSQLRYHRPLCQTKCVRNYKMYSYMKFDLHITEVQKQLFTLPLVPLNRWNCLEVLSERSNLRIYLFFFCPSGGQQSRKASLHEFSGKKTLYLLGK